MPLGCRHHHDYSSFITRRPASLISRYFSEEIKRRPMVQREMWMTVASNSGDVTHYCCPERCPKQNLERYGGSLFGNLEQMFSVVNKDRIRSRLRVSPYLPLCCFRYMATGTKWYSLHEDIDTSHYSTIGSESSLAKSPSVEHFFRSEQFSRLIRRKPTRSQHER